MQVTETRTEGLSREFQIVVPATDLDKKLLDELERIKPQVKMKGFRPGKVPVAFLKKTQGKAMMPEIVQSTINETTSKTLEERELRAAQTPKIDLEGELEPVLEGSADLEFKMSVELMPEFEPGDLSKIEVERPVAEVADEDIDKALENIREQQKTYKDIGETEAKEDHRLTIDFVGSIDGEEFEGGKAEDAHLVLGSNTFIPGFEEQLIGTKKGDQKTVKVTFPEDYSVEDLKGKDAEFQVEVKEVAEAELPEVDDELAKKLGLEDLKKLREALKDQIDHDYKHVSRDKLKRNLLDALDSQHSFELPPGMVEAEFEQVWGQVTAEMERAGKSFEDEGENEDESRAEYRQIAERRVRLGLLLGEIGRLNEIEVTQDELNQALRQRIQQFPGYEQQMYEYYTSSEDAIRQIQAPLFEDKVIDYVAERAKVIDKSVSRDDLFADPDDED